MVDKHAPPLLLLVKVDVLGQGLRKSHDLSCKLMFVANQDLSQFRLDGCVMGGAGHKVTQLRRSPKDPGSPGKSEFCGVDWALLPLSTGGLLREGWSDPIAALLGPWIGPYCGVPVHCVDWDYLTLITEAPTG